MEASEWEDTGRGLRLKAPLVLNGEAVSEGVKSKWSENGADRE